MKKVSSFSLVFVAICVGLNMVGANVALILHLPVYLDTIGTMMASLVLGPVFGIGTAVISALVNWLTDPFAIYYLPVGIVLALMTNFVIKPRQDKGSLVWKALIISLPGTLLASLITVMLFQGITSSGSSLIVSFLYGLGISKILAVILVQIGTDYLDRLISLALALLAIDLMRKHKSISHHP